MTEQVEVVIDAQAELGEGPLWDDREGVLYWVDIMGHRVRRYDPAAGEERIYDLGQPVSAVVPREKGGLVLAVERGFALFEPRTGTATRLATPREQREGTRFNDGKCDPAGRFWAGTMAYDLTRGAGVLYRLDPNGTVRPMAHGLTISNGIAWNEKRGVMYHIDTIPRTVWAYDYDAATGGIANRRSVWQVPPSLGYPDGMTLDREGRLWIAFFGGGAVRCWDPRRKQVVHTIELPVSQVTACAFGGTDLQTLYITTAHENMTPEQRVAEPLAGALFAARPGATGLPPYRYGG
jgi:sugar lactone lactonase YvrE